MSVKRIQIKCIAGSNKQRSLLMVKKISRKRCRQLYPKLPWSVPVREQYGFPETYRDYVLTLPSTSAKALAKNIGIALQTLLQNMGYQHLIFMGDSTIPWLYRQSDYRPAKEGTEYLIANKVSRTFNGGLMVDIENVAEFVKHLHWLVRTNTVLAHVHCVDVEQHIVASVCQYGDVHFCTLDEEADKLFHKHLPTSNLTLREGNTCSDI